MARKQLALAKISRPRLHDVMARTRLFGLLDKAVQRPVAWLCAQPGAGKTTLVASYLEARKRTGVWYQVDAGDADPASFVYHVRLAAHAEGAIASPEMLPLLTPEYLQDLPGFARRFFRDLFAGLGPRALLVLDNFQEVGEDTRFHAVMAAGLEQVPDDVAVVVLSRGEPPPAYAPLLANDAIAFLDGEQLRLTLAETRAIARRRGVSTDPAVESLHERSHGWAAGLTLLLTRTRRGGEAPEGDDIESLQHVFAYFAQRVFDGAAPEQQQALMQLAFLPQITVALAERVSGQREVGRLLDHFYKRHLFTDRRRVAAQPGSTATGVYAFQFHALFRSFLQHQARARHDLEGLRDIVCRCGAALADAGQWEPALDLFAEAADWPAFAATLLRHAEGLVAQGRHQTLGERLAQLPPDVRAALPWLGYWEGRVLKAGATERALALLRAQHDAFAERGDAAGQLACGAALVQTLWDARLGWSEIAPWADRLEPLMQHRLEFPSPGVELLTYSALHAVLAFCRPAHPAVRALPLRLLAFVSDEQIDWNQRLSTATHLIAFCNNAGDHDLALRLAAAVDARAGSESASVLNRAFWNLFRAIHDMRHSGHEEASVRLVRARELAGGEGFLHAEFMALQFHAYLDLMYGRIDAAQALLARLAQHPAYSHPDARMNYRVSQTMLAQLKGDSVAALSHAEAGMEAVEHIGAAYFQAAYPLMFTSAFVDAGRAERALDIVAASRRLAQGSYLEVLEPQLLLEEAYADIVGGAPERSHPRIAQALAMAAIDPGRAAYVHRIAARKPVLLMTALEAGIEVEFVRALIRQWRVAPPPREVERWPWALRIRTLGRFEVLLQDAPIEFGRKVPRKTLALLKAIVARGGSAADSALIDDFWPDESGDTAARSLAAAVHRLRLLLRDTDTVQQQGGRVILDRARVWVDAWSFERELEAARDPATGAAAVGRALELYQGAFLAEEEGEAWPVAMRERLRNKFVHTVAEHAKRLESAQCDEDAIRLYQRGLDADNVVEPFYQGLMRCYHRLGRLPEAVSAYRQLKQILSVSLSLPPSASTEKLYQTLRLA